MRTPCDTFFIALLILASLMSISLADSSSALLIRVDPLGKGDFKRIQDAIDAVPWNNSELIFISIKPGIYREKIVVPAGKPFITLSGHSAKSTIITWSEGWVTFQSPTVSILSSDFVGRYLTIQNTYGSNGPAVALRVAGDRAAFYTCRISSFQDTLLDENGRHYYKNCSIQGATDFICGNGLSLFEKCHVHSISKNGGAITAQRRSTATENTGYSFVNCRVTGVGSAFLGRPWGAYSRVVFAFTYMTNVVLPQGWDDWASPANRRTVFYGQYRCYGPGSRLSRRAPWAHQLSTVQARPFMTKSMIGGKDWLRPPPKHFRRFRP